jgi:hypothetical protein
MKVTRQAPPGHGFDLLLEFSGLLEAAERREAHRPDHKNVPCQLVISGGLGGGSP